MPISQERMLAVIDEAEQFIQVNKILINDIRKVLEGYNLSESQKLETIGGLIAMTMPQPFHTVIERRHFNRYAKRNERLKEKMWAKRQYDHGLAGTVPRKSPQVAAYRGPSEDYSHLQETLRKQTRPGFSPFSDDDVGERPMPRAVVSPVEQAIPGLKERIVELAGDKSGRTPSESGANPPKHPAWQSPHDGHIAPKLPPLAPAQDDSVVHYNESLAMVADDFPDEERKRILARAGKLPTEEKKG